MEKAYGYIRVSGKGQINGDGFARQTKAINDPTRKLVRQVLGAIAEYDKEMTVQKLRAARNRKKALTGKCEGRKSYHESNPELIAEIKQLRRKPRNGKRLSLKKCLESLSASGFTTSTGKQLTLSRLENIIYKSM